MLLIFLPLECRHIEIRITTFLRKKSEMEDALPPSYETVVRPNIDRELYTRRFIGPNPYISYVDLIPICTHSSLKFKCAKFERFK